MAAQRKRQRVLISDAAKNSREALVEIFCDAGYDVSSAVSGSETIEMLTRESFDLIFCDIDSPRKSGREIVRMAHALNGKARIIALSSSGSSSTRTLLKKEGAFEILDKPLRKAILLNTAAKAVKGSPAGRKQEIR